MLEFKHVSLYKGASDLLIGPRDEQLVVMVCLKYMHSNEFNDGGKRVDVLTDFFCKSS